LLWRSEAGREGDVVPAANDNRQEDGESKERCIPRVSSPVDILYWFLTGFYGIRDDRREAMGRNGFVLAYLVKTYMQNHFPGEHFKREFGWQKCSIYERSKDNNAYPRVKVQRYALICSIFQL
jgi:hypothetical protein